jgi:hypothetical protein
MNSAMSMLSDLAPDGMCRGYLFVSPESGSPTGWPLAFKILEEALWATTYRSASKVPRIEAAEQACCLLFQAEDRPYPYVVMNGRVAIVEPNRESVGRYMGWAAGTSPRRLPRVADRLLSAKRVFIQFGQIQEVLAFPEPS